jgi:translocation and assembly module TamA
LETGLVGNISIEPEKKPVDESSEAASEQPVHMVVKVKEAAPRVLGAGLRYATYDGIGANLFWRHNNIGGRGEHLGIGLQRSRREHKANVNYTIADFLFPEQKLMNEASYTWQLTRAYVGHTYNVGTRVERPLTESLKVYGGGNYEIGHLKREEVVYNTRLVGVPLGAKLDKSNDTLDPTSGYKVNVDVTPYYGRMRDYSGMTISQAGGAAYLPLLQNDLGESPIILASFARGGSIWINQTQAIPPNKRFYLGGGGSVRGYGYQLLGPLDKDRVPIGGRSFSEFGTEFRFKTSETVGFVSFLEAGSAQDGKMPHPTRNLLWGAGLGARYYSSIAPIRFDVGFPLKRRKDSNGRPIDSAFQLYVSIGQAF